MSPTKTGFGVRTVLGLAVVLGACAGPSTTIEHSWRTSAPAPQLTNVVTACVSRDGALRRTCEDDMARKLNQEGIRATPLYLALPDASLGERDGTKAQLAAAGYDGVVALRLVSREQHLEYVPGTFDYYWGPAWSSPYAYSPGYMYTETVVRIETSAYSLATNQLVWSALSKTVDPKSVRAGIDDVTNVAARELEKQQIVAGTPRPPGGA